MSRACKDYSRLPKGMFRKSDPVVEVKPISKTPSDYRSALNTATSITNRSF